MAINPLVKIATSMTVFPTSLAGTSIGVSYYFTPNKNTINNTNDKVKGLESRMREKIDHLIKSLFTEKIDNLNREIQKLNEKITNTESSLDSSAVGKTQELKDQVRVLEDLLKSSISSGKEKMEDKLSQLKTQIQDTKDNFDSQIVEKSSSLKANVEQVDQDLTNLVKRRMEISESEIRTALDQLRNQIFQLEESWKPSPLGRCSVVLTKSYRDIHGVIKPENQWRLEDFLPKIKENRNLTQQLKARCYQLEGVGRIFVSKNSQTNNFSYWEGQEGWVTKYK